MLQKQPGPKNMRNSPVDNAEGAQRMHNRNARAQEASDTYHKFVEALHKNLDDISDLRKTTRAREPDYVQML